MQNLKCKTQNPLVTMTMDISYRFHPHLIGRNGKNIEQIRKKTSTEIHVSSRNLTTSDESNSDIVTIVGELESLVKVFDLIRVSVKI
jgi:protein bicaudal C